MRTLRLIHKENGRTIGDQIVCADTPLLRLSGLLGKKRLSEGAGVWLQPSSGVHTFGMRFAIDVVGLDEQLRVLRLWPNLSPHRMTAIDFRVKSVVELAPGAIAGHGIQLLDQLILVENGRQSPQPSPGCAAFPAGWF